MPVPSPAACGNGVHTIGEIAQDADEGVGTPRQPQRTANFLVTDPTL